MTYRFYLGLLVGAFCLVLAPRSQAQITHIVDDDGVECPDPDFTSIQAAIDAASAGDIIEICAGEYRENEDNLENFIVVTKPLLIRGPNDGISACTPGGPPRVAEATLTTRVYIEADDVTLKGLRFTGDHYALILQRNATAHRAQIHDNVIEGIRRYGVLNRPNQASEEWVIANNRIGDWANADGAAVLLRNAPRSEVLNNCISNPGAPLSTGIRLDVAPGSHIAGNLISDMTGPGIRVQAILDHFDGLSVEENTISFAEMGIVVEGSPLGLNGIRLHANSVDHTPGPAVKFTPGAYGNVVVTDNEIHEAFGGIQMDGSPPGYDEAVIGNNRFFDIHGAAILANPGRYGRIQIEDNEGTRVDAEGVHVAGSPEGVDQLNVLRNRFAEIGWDAIKVWSGRYGSIVIGENEVTGAAAEGIHIHGSPEGIDEVHIGGNSITGTNFFAINLAPGAYGAIHLDGNEIHDAEGGLRVMGSPEGVGEAHIGGNRVFDVRGWGIAVEPPGRFGPLFIESNEIHRAGGEGIFVAGSPNGVAELHVNGNTVDEAMWSGITVHPGAYGPVHIHDNSVETVEGWGIHVVGSPEGIADLNIGGNRIAELRAAAINVTPGAYGVIRLEGNEIEQDVGRFGEPTAMIDVFLQEMPAGPVLLENNLIRMAGTLPGEVPAVYGVRVSGVVHRLRMEGNDVIGDGVPMSTGLLVQTGGPGLPALPGNARFQLRCNEFSGIENGVRVASADGTPGGFPGPPAWFAMYETGFRDVAEPINNDGESAEINARFNYWGSDDPPPDFPNVVENPFLTEQEYDFDLDGIRNCRDDDQDGDGLANEFDRCLGFPPDDAHPLWLGAKPNRWYLTGFDGTGSVDFSVGEKMGKGNGPGFSFDTDDTGTCSCGQILDNLRGTPYLQGMLVREVCVDDVCETVPVNEAGDPVPEGEPPFVVPLPADGHMKFGCSNSMMLTWTDFVASGYDPEYDFGLPEPILWEDWGGFGAGKAETGADASEAPPDSYRLEAAYPNPFNPTTTLSFDLPETARVRMAIFDVLGRAVRVLVDGSMEKGTHRVTFDAAGLPSGVYLVRFEHPKGMETKLVQLVK